MIIINQEGIKNFISAQLKKRPNTTLKTLYKNTREHKSTYAYADYPILILSLELLAKSKKSPIGRSSITKALNYSTDLSKLSKKRKSVLINNLDVHQRKVVKERLK